MLFASGPRAPAPWWAWLFAVAAIAAGSAWNLALDAPDFSVLVLAVLAISFLVASRFPSPALGLLILAVVLQFVIGVELNPAQAFAGVTFYLVGRNGRAWEHWSAAGTILVLGAFEIIAVFTQGSALMQLLFSTSQLASEFGLGAVLVAGVALLAVPLLAGIAEQAKAEARADEAARRRAEEALAGVRAVAAAEADRARLARDVHDTVGHALTVVITQSRLLSAVIARDHALALRTAASVERVASAALDEVRGVLAGAVAVADVTIDDLIDLANSTDRVRTIVRGDVPPLRGAAGDAAFHALQELLTNALRYGAPDQPVEVSIGVDDDASLVLEVVNDIDPGPAKGREAGSGLNGLRDRLDGVGGTVESGAIGGRWVGRVTIGLVAPS